jgi:(1->4)-alpha-D-glucan 1-alpha-D-glucosylmutase
MAFRTGDLSFVDPDSRRSVDFTIRARLPAETPDWSRLVQDWQGGHVKLRLTHRLLRIRAAFPDVFRHGEYRPAPVTDGANVITFSRVLGRKQVVAIVGRNFATVTCHGKFWPGSLQGKMELPDSIPLFDAIPGGPQPFERRDLSHLMQELPLAVLTWSPAP